MRFPHAVLLLATFGLTACEGDSESERLRAAPKKGFDCLVVEVLDDNVLEEGLGSIFDFDEEDGFSNVDGDSFGVSLRKSDFSKLKSKLILDIGQHSIGLHSKDDVLEEVKPEEDASTERVMVRGRRDVDEMFFIVTLFTATQVGIVHYQRTEAGAKAHKEELVDSCNFNFKPKSEELKECIEEAEFEASGKHSLARVDCRKGVAAPDFDAL